MPPVPESYAVVAAPSDNELVTRHLAGDGEAFDELYRRYQARLVVALTARFGDPGLAEDAAHDAMLRAMHRLHTFDLTQPLWPWLSALAGNVATDRFRRDQRLRWDPAPDDRVAPDHSDGLEERRLVHTALAELPERQRRALVLSYLIGWSAAEAADLLGITRNAFDQLLHRGRANLRQAYLAIDPESSRRLHTLMWPVVVMSIRRLRTRVQAGVETAMSMAQPASVAVMLPALVVGAASFVHPPTDISAMGLRPPRLMSVQQGEHHSGSALPGVVASGGAIANPPGAHIGVDVGDQNGRRSEDGRRRSLTSPPAAVDAGTTSQREHDRLRGQSFASASVNGEKSQVGHKGDAYCSTAFQNAACEASETVRGSVQQVFGLGDQMAGDDTR